ncbi:MAG: T9SS type A sorting domain-containing protein [Flavobacteriales bacterium]|nr:T9SS type A sorting domain-containing protein [Flavobacteriales bacterium]MBK9286795.1 T9SS type A sorting domain-containing protein [Flavobacteriales bacterium]MBL0035283.1 T9SS type A sorting domain-containing protein [Flavobacteriales bacterium]
MYKGTRTVGRLALALAALAPLIVSAQVIPADRLTDWSQPGSSAAFVPTQSVSLTAFGADSTGVLPCDQALTDAIAALGGPGEVLIPAGDYRFAQTIVLPDSIILQGEVDPLLGTPLARLILSPGNASHGIAISGSEAPMALTTGSTLMQGSSTITVNQSLPIVVGDWLRLIATDDSSLVNDWWGVGQTGQIVQVMSVINSTMVLANRPLRRNYTAAASINKLTPRRQVHLRCLGIKREDASTLQVANIFFNNAVDCSLSGVVGDLCNYAHVDIFRSARITVQDCSFKDAYSFAGGGEGYGVLVDFTSGDCYIHRNTFEHLRHSMILQAGANGNVFAYNHSTEPFWSAFPLPNDAAGDLVLHGNYPYMNLFEGNVVQNIVIDDSHGINGPNNLFFRNRAELYGIFMNTAPPSDHQTFIGNQVTDTTSSLLGLYSLQGTGHFTYGNQIKGVVLPAGSTEPTDATLFSYVFPSFYPALPGVPPIRNNNWLATDPLNEAEYRKEVLGQVAACGDSLFYTITGIPVESSLSSPFKLYPDPAVDHIVLEGALPIGGSVRVVDALGRTLELWTVPGSRAELDISSLAPGIHFLVLPDAGHTVLRFVKQ